MNSPEARHQELAGQFGETKFDPENQEQHEALRRVAQNILDCFDWQPDRESFLVVTDTKVMQDNPLMLKALEHDLQERSARARKEKPGAGHYKFLTTEASPKSATPLGPAIGEAMRDNPVLIITSMSRSHSRETGAASRGDMRFSPEKLRETVDELSANSPATQIDEARLAELSEHIPGDYWSKLEKMARDRRSRIVSITKGHNPYEILTKGAVFEAVETLRERADKVRGLMEDVERVHITTPLGTDVWLKVRPELAEIEDGRVDKPGKLSNFPIGEWSCSPDWEGSSGILVVDGPCGGNINQDIIDKGEPLKLIVENGQIVRCEGGKEAMQMWQAYLESGNNDHNDSYRLAELGIGTNGRALEDKPREYWGSSEGEKKYGTCHIAVGSNGTFGRDPKTDPNFNSAQVHCDMVLGLNKGGEPTIECFTKDGSSFTLLENGKPVGY